MNSDDINVAYMKLLGGDKQGLNVEEFNAAYEELESIHNLNVNPMATLCAGRKIARLAFVLGAQWATAKGQP